LLAEFFPTTARHVDLRKRISAHPAAKKKRIRRDSTFDEAKPGKPTIGQAHANGDKKVSAIIYFEMIKSVAGVALTFIPSRKKGGWLAFTSVRAETQGMARS